MMELNAWGINSIERVCKHTTNEMPSKVRLLVGQLSSQYLQNCIDAVQTINTLLQVDTD